MLKCKNCGGDFIPRLPKGFDLVIPGMRRETKAQRLERMSLFGVYCSHKCRTEQNSKAQLLGRCNTYGITVEEYWVMFESQLGLCAICKTEQPDGRSMAIDHCHAKGHVRGLLCRRCNTGLGVFEDDIDRLLSAVAYLRNSHKT